MRYARLQLTDFDAQGTQVAERLLAVSLSGLLVAALIIGYMIGRFLIEGHSDRWRQALGLQPSIGGLANLFDRQVQCGGCFFL